ncbi:MAG: YciI family protein [Actinomycetota bacterium]
MAYFAVTRQAGPGWTDGGIFDQQGVNEHTTFMNALGDRGVVLLAGPLAGTENGRLRVLVIMNVPSEGDIRRILAADPWVGSEHLVTTSIESWNVFVGAERLPTAQDTGA